MSRIVEANMDRDLACVLEEFRAEAELVGILYRADAQFAEICDDFVLLRKRQPADADIEKHIDASLTGLREEIATYLRAHRATVHGRDADDANP